MRPVWHTARFPGVHSLLDSVSETLSSWAARRQGSVLVCAHTDVHHHHQEGARLVSAVLVNRQDRCNRQQTWYSLNLQEPPVVAAFSTSQYKALVLEGSSFNYSFYSHFALLSQVQPFFKFQNNLTHVQGKLMENRPSPTPPTLPPDLIKKKS